MDKETFQLKHESKLSNRGFLWIVVGMFSTFLIIFTKYYTSAIDLLSF